VWLEKNTVTVMNEKFSLMQGSIFEKWGEDFSQKNLANWNKISVKRVSDPLLI